MLKRFVEPRLFSYDGCNMLILSDNDCTESTGKFLAPRHQLKTAGTRSSAVAEGLRDVRLI